VRPPWLFWGLGGGGGVRAGGQQNAQLLDLPRSALLHAACADARFAPSARFASARTPEMASTSAATFGTASPSNAKYPPPQAPLLDWTPRLPGCHFENPVTCGFPT